MTITTEPAVSKKDKFARLKEQNPTSNSLSIHELTKTVKKTAEEIASEAYTSEARETFDNDTFLVAWKELAERIKTDNEEGNSIVYPAMMTRVPVLKDNFKIEVAVDNKSQLEELTVKRTDFHDFLRKKLKNGGIEVSFRVEKDKKRRKAYTSEEKFNKMAEQNPHLITMKKELGLDFT